ncbi:uncharacterized protein LOC106871198 [Octopus bimaculoides]|uniref:Uncharacterized protein n=1 Tax=Octopus bimaculoides TaxID=37653 RepID=A0A0L8IE69_OCTBM|nr:uncharacterized protein LOC106871198 [Octopus bimaculoides]|eukprot:XP_014773034.1 PREDICTED: uncharacterized protein LOC106871198 [Octopus bimaculoides]
MFPDVFHANVSDIDVDEFGVSNKCSREHSNDFSTPCLYRRRSSVMSQTSAFMKENESEVSFGGLLILCICFMYATLIFLIWTIFGKIFSLVHLAVSAHKNRSKNPFELSHSSNFHLKRPISSGR